ncbi:MAG: prephenate dehydratase [Candidatus Lokiarchaeota archaeon]|nr:prephenate dehydratase [Candidatus Lokiarchaeota archaeon]
MSEEEKNKEELNDLRKEIEEVDDEIVDLLNKRGNFAITIGNIKKNLNLEIHQPKREEEIIDRIKNKPTVFTKEGIIAIWKEIMSASKAIQGTISKVGYLGPMGTFTHQAALEFFAKAGTQFLPYNSTSDIFDSIEKGELDYGIVPFENSLQGTVRKTLDLLIERELYIYGEVEIRVVQNLICLSDAKLSDIETIISHPQAFAQTKAWLKANLPNAKMLDINSTAEAVKRVRKLNDKSYAAIGPEFAAELYDLKILNSMIEDESSNFTRFLILSKSENPVKGEKMKTSIVFVTKHIPGALYWVLKIFSDAEINLSKIESRPRRKGRWEYIFFMDFEADKNDPRAVQAIEHMKANVIWQKILGTFPLK